MGATTTTMSNVLAANVRTYAEIQHAFDECDSEIQAVVREMLGIVNDPEADEAEKGRAINTIVEAIFPGLGAELMQVEKSVRRSGDGLALRDRFAQEEQIFSDRLSSIMREKSLTQEVLAERAGVSQSAIANLLSRECRPQRRTIMKFAQALGVTPESLWPGIADEPTS
jgi:lambda repressor-like predicted transcriptional regulator